MIHAPGILRVRVLIDGRSTVLLGKKFFDFPGIRFNAHRELEVFFCDVIPELQDRSTLLDVEKGKDGTYLVDHHDGE